MNTGLRLISSTREKDKLELNEGESFVYDRESKNGVLTFWRCYKRGKCKARLHLTKEALERLKNGQSVEPSSWKTLGRHIHDKTTRSYQSRRPFNTTIPDSTQNNTTSDTSVVMPSSDQFPCSSNQLSSASNTQREGPSAAGQNIADYDISEFSQVLLLSRASREVENLSTNGTSQQPNQEIHFNQQQQIVNGNSSASSQLHGIQTVQQNTINPPNFSIVSTTTCTSTTETLISPRCQPPLAKKTCYGNHSNTSNLFQRETSDGQNMLCNILPSFQTTHGQNLQNMTHVTSDHRLLSSGSYLALRNTLKVAGNPRPQLSRQHVKNLLKTLKFSLSKVIAIVDCNSYCEIECNTREDVVDLFDLLKSHKTNLNITVELYKKENICVNLEFVSRILDERFLLSYFQENHGSVSDSGLTWQSDEDGILNGKCTVVMKRRDLDRRPIPDKIVINGREIHVRYEDQAMQAQLLPPISHAVSIEPDNFNAYASAEPELVENEPISANQSTRNPRVPSSVSTSSCMDSENVSPPMGFQHASIMPRASTPFTITPQVISSQFLPVGSPIPSFASVCAARFNRPMVTVGNMQRSRPQPSPRHASRFVQPLHNFGNMQQSRPQPSPHQVSRIAQPLHNYHMNFNNNHGLQARLTNNAPSCFQQATGFAPRIYNQVQPALPQQPHRNRGYHIMSNPPLAHPGGASQHSDPSQRSQIAVVPIQDMQAGTSGTVVQVGGFIPTMSRESDGAALPISNQNSQLLSTSQIGDVGQPLTNQNNEFASQQPTHEECRQNMMDTSFVNSGGYAQHSTTLEDLVNAIVPSQAMPIIGNLGTTDSIGNNISSLNQNFHEVEQPASNQYTELQSTSKSQQQQTDEEYRVDVEETASMQHSDLSEVEDSESDNLSSDSSDGEADDDMSGNSLYGSVENSQHRKIIRKLMKMNEEEGEWDSDDVYHLQRLYKRIHKINDEQLTSKALELFPEKLSFYSEEFTELDSFLFVLTKVEKCIELLDLSYCFSEPEDFGRLFSAIQQMPGKIKELKISGNIIPEIPSSSFFNKVSEELWMRRCFHDEDASGEKRDANQSEKDEIQQNLDQLDNLELEVYVGVDDDRCLVSLSSQKQFDVTTTKNAERRKITHKIEKFQHGCNVYGDKDDDKRELLRVYEQIHQINDEQLTTNAAELFPEELRLSFIKLTESQIDSLLFILTKVEKRIQSLQLFECFSKPEDVGRLFEAIQAMPGKIGWLDISYNIIPKIPSKSFFNKIEDGLIMYYCFPDDDATGGKRHANQSEIAEIQRVLDQLDDSKLKVDFGWCDGKSVKLGGSSWPIHQFIYRRDGE